MLTFRQFHEAKQQSKQADHPKSASELPIQMIFNRRAVREFLKRKVVGEYGCSQTGQIFIYPSIYDDKKK